MQFILFILPDDHYLPTKKDSALHFFLKAMPAEGGLDKQISGSPMEHLAAVSYVAMSGGVNNLQRLSRGGEYKTSLVFFTKEELHRVVCVSFRVECMKMYHQTYTESV